MSPELFARVGEALYGPNWHAPFAAALNVSVRNVGRMASGYSRIPPGMVGEVRRLIAKRGNLIAAVRDELDAAIAQAGGRAGK